MLFIGLMVSKAAMGQPFNDNWNANGSDLPFPFATTGNNINATVQAGEQNLTLPPTGSTVWWFFNAPSSGAVTINTNGSNFDTVLHVYTDFQNGFGNFTLVASNDDSGGTLQSSVTFPVNAGQCYEVRVGGFNGAQGSIALNGSAPPPVNDNWPNDVPGFVPPFFTEGTNFNATVEPLEQDLDFIGATVWWFINVPDNGMATIDTFGSDYDTILHVYTDFENGFGNFTLVAANDDSGGTLQSSVTFPVNAFQFYEIRVGGFGFFEPSMGNIDLMGFFTPGGVLLGDVNLDGVVNLQDVAPFVALLTGGGFQAEADVNQDGAVDLLDVNPFVTVLTGG